MWRTWAKHKTVAKLIFAKAVLSCSWEENSKDGKNTFKCPCIHYSWFVAVSYIYTFNSIGTVFRCILTPIKPNIYYFRCTKWTHNNPIFHQFISCYSGFKHTMPGSVDYCRNSRSVWISTKWCCWQEADQVIMLFEDTDFSRQRAACTGLSAHWSG